MARPVTAPTPENVRPPALILEEIAAVYGLAVDVLRGPERTRFISTARAAAARALRENGMAYAEIGVLLGGRDHSTIQHLVKNTPTPHPQQGRE